PEWDGMGAGAGDPSTPVTWQGQEGATAPIAPSWSANSDDHGALPGGEYLAFFRATKLSRSTCVIGTCPSCTSPAWRLSIGHFYFAQIGHYHFAPTNGA